MVYGKKLYDITVLCEEKVGQAMTFIDGSF